MSLISPSRRARTDDQGDRGDLRAASLRQIHREIVEGNLRNERARLDEALYNLEFYRGDFSRFPVRPPGQQQDPTRYPRYTPFLQRVVWALCQHLYARGPARRLRAPAGMPAAPYDAASRWLEGVYRRNCADAIWQEADRLTVVSGVAAIQVAAGPDPARPIRLRLWDASQFVVWEDPDEPTRPVAVGTIDLFDRRRRLTLYTDAVKRVYVTQKLGPDDAAGGMAYQQISEAENPYGLIPFAFAWFHMPVGSDFWCGSPGCLLRNVNDGLNFGLTEGFDCVRYNLRPVVLLKNVRGGFRPPSPIRPGDVWSLPEMADATGEGGGGADAAYLQADSAFVAASWEDFRSYVDMVLEHVGVPPGTIKMEQASVASGVRVIADHIPLIQWAESRQRPFARYEDELAKLVLTVGAGHLGAQSDRDALATADALGQVAADPGLVLRWADMYPYLPGPDRNADDGWLLGHHLTSRTMVLMKREQLTRAEARQRLDEIAEDERHERAVLGLDAGGRPRAEHGPGAEGRGRGARATDGGGVGPPPEVGGPDDEDDDGDGDESESSH
jgi:hypothetical protein